MRPVAIRCCLPVQKKRRKYRKIKADAERKDDFHRRSVRSRKVLSDQSAPVRRTDGNRRYQQKNCKRKAYHEAFRTDHDQSGFLYYGYTGIQFPLCE